ncbi:oligoendopeptidase, M3 family [Geotalea daltonii FRC-32]|uniref:Oligoendopeptidase, M3 family n=1 Tax=Geotalea daltonii (strain DSM 22248 / JCM 15807 / FRC-32) TaxID=316067 RepID=B9M6M5_GEODF|nr:M3 family oligoendopeptidase [Geotalea daltonii]ACM20085.1 oligoendopeptidase, M3 family [Geotalea daltonii FRC-32]
MKKIYLVETETLLKWTWAEIEPHYQKLQAFELNTGNVDAWLKDWSDLTRRVYEIPTRLVVRTWVNTADEEGKRLYSNFLDTIFPKIEEAENGLNKKILDSKLEPKNLRIALRNMRAEADLFREENLPLRSEEEKTGLEYNKIRAAQTIEWANEERTVAQMYPLQLEKDRATRETAMRMVLERQYADFEALGEIWIKLMEIRRQVARNAGKADYRAYQWQNKRRFDYTPEDAKSFHRAIEEVVVPATARIRERRRKILDVATLRPWDTEADSNGLDPIRPFKTMDELNRGMKRIFDKVDPDFGDRYQTMLTEGLLDLENRKNKAPGGYCTMFPVAHRPFIFMNSVGTHADVNTLLHEGGHSFHVFETAGTDLFHNIKYSPAEFNEVASMAMELLGGRYLMESGMYTAAEAAQARIKDLETHLLSWPSMAVADALQHWIYENHHLASDPVRVSEKWSELYDRYMVGLDWSDLEQYKAACWQSIQHIYLWPFYYVEYGLAQLGASQIWANSLADYPGAVKAYRKALSLGATVTLPELFAAAGAKFSFDAATLKRSVDLIERTIEELDSAHL